MADYQVTCIVPDGADADRRIDRLGGPNWNDSIDNVIRFIKTGAHRFYTSVGGRRSCPTSWCKLVSVITTTSGFSRMVMLPRRAG